MRTYHKCYKEAWGTLKRGPHRTPLVVSYLIESGWGGEKPSTAFSEFVDCSGFIQVCQPIANSCLGGHVLWSNYTLGL